MKHFAMLSLLPAMFETLNHGIVGRAKQQGLVDWRCFNPRDYTDDPHRTVDDRPYGGGAGMVLKLEPVLNALTDAKQYAQTASRVCLLSPQGVRVTQHSINQLAQSDESIILLCGRYEGFDDRIMGFVDESYSVGDFVMSGGELPAMCLMDAIIRCLPEVLGNPASFTFDSFQDDLLDYPHYTRPENFSGKQVPDVLLSGDHSAIALWRRRQSLLNTWLSRPELLAHVQLTARDMLLLKEALEDSQRSKK